LKIPNCQTLPLAREAHVSPRKKEKIPPLHPFAAVFQLAEKPSFVQGIPREIADLSSCRAA
jgi:hypothetical protein